MPSTVKRYPLSAPNGEPIPFDIGYPLGLIILPIAVAASAAIEFPADADIAVLYASCDCVISFGDSSPLAASVAEGVFSDLHLFIPSKGSISIQLPAAFISCISADGATVGKLYINVFAPWEGLSKDLLGRRM